MEKLSSRFSSHFESTCVECSTGELFAVISRGQDCQGNGFKIPFKAGFFLWVVGWGSPSTSITKNSCWSRAIGRQIPITTNYPQRYFHNEVLKMSKKYCVPHLKSSWTRHLTRWVPRPRSTYFCPPRYT